MKCFRTYIFPIFIYYLTIIRIASNTAQDVLPFCDSPDGSGRYIFVSTLDGKVTALDAENGGSVLWSVHPGDMPMLSSSIHKLELTNYGQFVRMIPSLNGGLYKFNGENVEPIPLSAEHLLQASFRYSDDLVISGGKESQTMGVSLKTGEVLYECSMRGCKDEDSNPTGDVLVIQRQGQVVRAVEPRSGTERWNFSVAQHQVKLISECHSPGQNAPLLQLKIIVPEGLVCVIDPTNPSNILWEHQFSSPVVSAWEGQKGQLFEVDLFSKTTQIGTSSPSLYIGMHKQQLYIQESVRMLMKRQELSHNYGQNLLTHENSQATQLPWRPTVANARAAGLESLSISENDTALEEVKTTALSVLYASPFVDGAGFFLYSEEDLKKSEGLCNATLQIEGPESEPEEETPVTIVIVSLWYWWREVAIISITTAILFNFFTRRFMRNCDVVIVPKAQVVLPEKNVSDSGIGLDAISVVRTDPQPMEYVSRYLTDFDPVCCMGKGGYGVVFEARNKIDDCCYAIKRIVLPDAPESRERVMREVRALAKLDHHNIVRYFNAWVENPPPGWQLAQDRLWSEKYGDSLHHTGQTSEATTDRLASVSSLKDGHFSSMSFRSHSTLEVPSKLNDDQSDSFIIFASDSQGSKQVSDEHSILVEASNNISKVKEKGKRPSEDDWAHHSSIFRSSSKVYLYIQMQLCQRESLKDWLMNNRQRDYATVVDIFDQIVKAVEYVHLHNLIHRDLKPSNIFFSLDQQIKVGDFGLVTTIDEVPGRFTPSVGGDQAFGRGHTAQVGTQLYMSPEQMSGKSYSYKVDIFSLGLILFELLVPFSTQFERQRVMEKVRENQFPDDFSKKYTDELVLLKLMLSHSPDERPTTFGLRARPPLLRDKTAIDETTSTWQFDLPNRKRGLSRTSVSSGSSGDVGFE